MSAPRKQMNGNKYDIDFSVNTEDITSFALSVTNEPENEASLKNRSNTSKGTAKKQTEKKATSKSQKPRLPNKISSAPDGLPVVEYTINPTNLTCFSGGGHYLSTFYRSQFEMNGIRYGSVEEYYQATKLYALCGHDKAAKLQYIREPFKIKQTAKEILRQCRVPHNAIDAWKRTDGLITLIYAVGLKFIQNPQLREELLNTKDTIIVQTHAGDNLFATGMNQADFEKWAGEHSGQTIKLPYAINEYTVKHVPMLGKGQNLLGVILMKVRQELLTSSVADLYSRESVNRILTKLVG